MNKYTKALIVLLSLGCISSMQAHEDHVDIKVINLNLGQIKECHKSDGTWKNYHRIIPKNGNTYSFNTGKDHQYAIHYNGGGIEKKHGGHDFRGKTTWNVETDVIS